MDRALPCGLAALLVASSCASEDTTAGPWGHSLGGSAGTSGNSGSSGNAGSNSSCTASTCETLAAKCGTAPDGCGGILQCGDCPAGVTCGGGGPNRCGTNACSPATCQSAGAECGPLSDGCASTLSCGECASGTCVANECSACTPNTCQDVGAACGSIADGCGSNLDCGSCSGGHACQSGSCVCPSSTRECGSECIDDGTCCSNDDCSGMTLCASPGQKCACRTSPARQPIYRSFHTNGGQLLSDKQGEGPSAGYWSEAIAFYTYRGPCEWGLVPFYRLHNPATGEHFYTKDAKELSDAIGWGWQQESDIGCVAPQSVCGSAELYRLRGSMHRFTTDAGERDSWLSSGYSSEGTACFVWKTP